MPRRRRGQEAKRALRRVNVAANRTEAEIRAHDALVSADPLDDRFWNKHEGKEFECCADDDGPNHPLNVLADAREEIDAYLKSSTTRA